MFDFLSERTGGLCGPSHLKRREFLQVGALSALGLSLPQYLSAKSAGAVKPGYDERSCILIFNLGGPPQVDLWDMKPDAPAEVRGPFKPIRTNAPEIQISEILPLHAKIADQFSLVRSCHHDGAAVHDAGWQIMQTGRRFTGGVQTPHMGAVASHLLGKLNDLPPFMVLPELMGRGGGNLPNGQAGGFLGKAYDPFALMADPSKPNFKVPDLLPPDLIGAVRLDRRQQMREVIERAIQQFEASEDARLMDENFHAAFRLMTSEQARSAFDLSKEPDSVRDRYGRSRFGQSCLLARRLVENGVRFVTLNTFLTVFGETTWDIHGSKPFTSIDGMKNEVCPMYDQAYSALIEDLKQRGMLANTMVAALSEFGRTPKINKDAGRDHHARVFSCFMAGGGVKGGQVIGSSDKDGMEPADRPVQVADLHASVCHALGIDFTRELTTPLGRPMKLVKEGAKPVKELFA